MSTKEFMVGLFEATILLGTMAAFYILMLILS